MDIGIPEKNYIEFGGHKHLYLFNFFISNLPHYKFKIIKMIFTHNIFKLIYEMDVGVRLSMILLTNQGGWIKPILEVWYAASYFGWAYNSVKTES